MQRSELKLFVCLLCFPSPRYDVWERSLGRRFPLWLTFRKQSQSAAATIYHVTLYTSTQTLDHHERSQREDCSNHWRGDRHRTCNCPRTHKRGREGGSRLNKFRATRSSGPNSLRSRRGSTFSGLGRDRSSFCTKLIQRHHREVRPYGPAILQCGSHNRWSIHRTPT